MGASAVDILIAARRVADFVSEEEAFIVGLQYRSAYTHMGALVADAILQAGLNYASIVQPRVNFILKSYPNLDRTTSLVKLVDGNGVAEFLNWRHPVKISRFERLVEFLFSQSIEHVVELRSKLMCSEFCQDLLKVNGIGLKTVDYLKCLVGIDAIAVDRHVRKFAARAGVEDRGYQFLFEVFCCAADLLAVPRRDFDAWIWKKESSPRQLSILN